MSDLGLTPQQFTVVTALSNGASLTAAAAEAGVHRNTIRNWRREAMTFQMALASAEYDRALLYRERAEALADLAFDALRSILADPQASPGVRLKAALTITNLVTTPPTAEKKIAPTIEELIMAPLPVGHNCAKSEPPSPEPAAPAPSRNITIRHHQPIPGRNDQCPCGSGLKFKRCCLGKPASQSLATAA